MDANAILQAIGSIGFPIVMCLILMKYVQNTQDKLIEAIQNLTLAVKRLETLIEGDDDNDRTIRDDK